MAKINHSSYLDVVHNIVSTAKGQGVMHIQSEEKYFDGDAFTVDGAQLKNFGTCGYLGMEMHPKLIEGSIEMTKKFGTQFSMSRTFIQAPYMKELEEHISKIFNGHKALCYSATSTAHISVLNTLIKPTDCIVLDQQVHFSVQYPCKSLKTQGTEVQMIRHSDWKMLERILINGANKYERIWYMADGVYSMYGDFPDTDKLAELMQKYPKLHLYFDDAHGMGWEGKNGAGYVFDRLGVNERIILISTLAKGFGCVGGTAIFGDEEMYEKVNLFGGPLTYSHPLSPGTAGAAIASAKIHLSDEIYKLQNELKELIAYTNFQLSNKNLPNISSPHSPIYFIGAGSYKVTLNLVNRMLKDGFYLNPATFPAVPNDKTGLRFTITRHRTKEDIKAFVDALAYHFPLAIQEEGKNIEDIYKKFEVEYDKSISTGSLEENNDLNIQIQQFSSIHEIDPKEWDEMFEPRGNISHSGMQCIEEIFRDNPEKENNWTFHYLVIRDEKDKIIFATFFTGTWIKDDMLSLENISRKIEEVRKTDPYYLCTKTLVMGCMFADGNFVHIDTSYENWKKVVLKVFKIAEELKQKIDAKSILFRDFEEHHPMVKLMDEEGFAKVRMPNVLVIENPKWNSVEELMQLIPSKKKRINIKRDAVRHVNKFDICYKSTINKEEAELYYELFENIKDNNFDFNFFKFPKKIASVISKFSEWEFIDIKLKNTDKTVASVWAYIGKNHYSPLIMGLDYDYIESHQIYKQAIFQLVKRGNDLNKKRTYIGFSAEFEKKKYMAKVIPSFAFIKLDDTYNLELVDAFDNTKLNYGG